MNPTTANPAAGALLPSGGAARPDARKPALADQAGQGDFQRMLAQAAAKKTAAKQQQTGQLETRQAEQRLQEHKLQEHKLQEQRQANISPSRAQESSSSAAPSVNQSQAVRPNAGPSSAQPAEQRDTPKESALGEASDPTAPAGPPAAPSAANPDQPEPVAEPTELTLVLPVELTTAELAALSPAWADMSIHAQVPVSLEEIAQAVMTMIGAAAMSAESATPGREQAAVLGGIFRPSPAAFYSNSTQSGSAYAQILAGSTESRVADDTATTPELNFTALTRQLTGTATTQQTTEQLMTGGHAVEISSEPNIARDGALLSSPGQSLDGKPAPLTPTAAQFNLAAGMRAGVGQPEWHNAIAERVAVMASKNLTSAEIQLDPPELGQLLVRVTLNQEQASVTFTSQHAAVREALDQTAHRLREMFDAEGLNLVNVDVSDRSFQQRQQQEAAAMPGGGAGSDEESIAEPVLVRQGESLIDHFV